tara:strand:- start:25 stop:1092 length:1068 start_codon:yes stop_codon:yes gene_type:complete
MAYTTIDDPSAHFQIALYSGNNTSQSITLGGNSDLQPDVVWIKERNGAEDHCIFDSSRSGSERLSPNTTGATWDDASNVTSFDSDGFSVGSSDQLNDSGNTQVAWCWKVNGGTTTTNDASSTSVGNQDSVYQVNTTAGFSIGTYSGASQVGTMAHGLSAVPHVMIVKCRSDAEPWEIYHHKNTSAPETEYIRFDSANGTADSAHIWNDTAPTSSIFTVGNTGSGNESNKTYVFYMWKEIQGYSKFGSYTGNGNADGAFVYTGFKPAFVIQKQSSANGEYWMMKDNAREPHNQADANLYPNANNAEGDTNGIDLLSNGFKCRTTGAGSNASTATYIYMAWAEHPFVSSEGVPTTAR